MSSSTQNPNNNQITRVVHTDQAEKQHLNQVANQVGQATSTQVDPIALTPIKNQHPLPQFNVSTENQKGELEKKIEESEVLDMFEGLQGKPRTGKAADFLKDKVELMKKKYGDNVTLVKK